MVYAEDLKSSAPNRACGFDSHPGHHVGNVKDSDVASLRSAAKSYGGFGGKRNSRFRKIWFEPMFFCLVPREGVEPSCPCEHRILSPACLPFHHLGSRIRMDAERIIYPARTLLIRASLVEALTKRVGDSND